MNLTHLFERTMATKSTLTEKRTRERKNNNNHVSCSQSYRSRGMSSFELIEKKWEVQSNDGMILKIAAQQNRGQVRSRSIPRRAVCQSDPKERRSHLVSPSIILFRRASCQQKKREENTRSTHTISYSSQWKPMIRDKERKQRIRLNQIPVNEEWTSERSTRCHCTIDVSTLVVTDFSPLKEVFWWEQRHEDEDEKRDLTSSLFAGEFTFRKVDINGHVQIAHDVVLIVLR